MDNVEQRTCWWIALLTTSWPELNNQKNHKEEKSACDTKQPSLLRCQPIVGFITKPSKWDGLLWNRKNGIMVALLSATAQVMQYQLVNKTVEITK